MCKENIFQVTYDSREPALQASEYVRYRRARAWYSWTLWNSIIMGILPLCLIEAIEHNLSYKKKLINIKTRSSHSSSSQTKLYFTTFDGGELTIFPVGLFQDWTALLEGASSGCAPPWAWGPKGAFCPASWCRSGLEHPDDTWRLPSYLVPLSCVFLGKYPRSLQWCLLGYFSHPLHMVSVSENQPLQKQ